MKLRTSLVILASIIVVVILIRTVRTKTCDCGCGCEEGRCDCEGCDCEKCHKKWKLYGAEWCGCHWCGRAIQSDRSIFVQQILTPTVSTKFQLLSRLERRLPVQSQLLISIRN